MLLLSLPNARNLGFSFEMINLFNRLNSHRTIRLLVDNGVGVRVLGHNVGVSVLDIGRMDLEKRRLLGNTSRGGHSSEVFSVRRSHFK